MWSTERRDLTAATVTNAAGHSIVYVIGGRTTAGASLGKVMAYDVTANTWTTKASLPRPLWGMNQAAVLKGRIYVSGGCYYKGCSQFGPSEQTVCVRPGDGHLDAEGRHAVCPGPGPGRPGRQNCFSPGCSARPASSRASYTL